MELCLPVLLSHMMQHSEPWCKKNRTRWKSCIFKSSFNIAWTLYFCTHTHTCAPTHTLTYKAACWRGLCRLEFQQKESQSTSTTEQIWLWKLSSCQCILVQQEADLKTCSAQRLEGKYSCRALSPNSLGDCSWASSAHLVGRSQKMRGLQASMCLGIAAGMQISTGMPSDILLCVNVCSWAIWGKQGMRVHVSMVEGKQVDGFFCLCMNLK